MVETKGESSLVLAQKKFLRAIMIETEDGEDELALARKRNIQEALRGEGPRRLIKRIIRSALNQAIHGEWFVPFSLDCEKEPVLVLRFGL